MKQVFVAQYLTEAYLVKELLESQGIAAEVSDDALSDVRGEASATPATLPSVWVLNDSDRGAAFEMLRDFRHFFPPGVLTNGWYVCFLLAMQESPLYPPAADSPPVYRLLHLPTFQQPSVVRLTGGDDGWRVACKRTDGACGYFPGQIVVTAERDLTRAKAKQFDCLLEQVAFWDMASTEMCAGLDGTRAVFEGACGGRYHVVDRWTPRCTPYANLVQFLLGL